MLYSPGNAETAPLHQMKPVPVPYCGGETAAAFNARTGLPLTQIVALNTNESPYPPVQTVRRTLQALPFVLFRLAASMVLPSVQQAMERAGMLLRYFPRLDGKADYLRITVGESVYTDRLIETLLSLMPGYGSHPSLQEVNV